MEPAPSPALISHFVIKSFKNATPGKIRGKRITSFPLEMITKLFEYGNQAFINLSRLLFL